MEQEEREEQPLHPLFFLLFSRKAISFTRKECIAASLLCGGWLKIGITCTGQRGCICSIRKCELTVLKVYCK